MWVVLSSRLSMVGYDASAAELEGALSEALGKFGAVGTVSVRGMSAWLEGSGPPVSVEVASLLAEWPALGPELRKRRATDVARRLVSDRRAQTGASGAGSGFALPSFAAPVGIAALALVALAAAWTGYQRWMAGRDASAARPIADYDAYERERAERAARVCAQTRARVTRGAAIGPTDVEGWVVELTLLRAGDRPLLDDPALAPFLEVDASTHRGRVRSATSPRLNGLDGPDTAVVVSEANVPPLGAADLRGLEITFSGRYVAPYFTDGDRSDFAQLARELTDALKADYAGLYARCAASTSHHLGSWFHGPTPGGAVTALVYFLGTYSDPTDVRGPLLVPPGAGSIDRGFAFKNVKAATEPLKKARVVSLVSTEYGAVAGTDDQPATLTFPFRDSNRASRSSHTIARDLGIGDGR